MVWGGELLVRDGVAAGQATSGRVGRDARHRRRAGVGAGAEGVTADAAYVRAGDYQLDVGGRRIPLTVEPEAAARSVRASGSEP